MCTDQLQLYEGALGGFAERGAQLYGVSCDSSWAQKAFREKLGVSSEQLSDFEPKGATCAAFGVLHPGLPPARARDRRSAGHRALGLCSALAQRAAGRSCCARA